MYINATAITRFVMHVVDTLDAMGYDTELASLDPMVESARGR